MELDPVLKQGELQVLHRQTISKEATQDRVMSAYIVSNEDMLPRIVPHGFQHLEILVLLQQIRETMKVQYHVTLVDHNVFFVQPTQKLTGEDNSSHVQHKAAVSLHGKIA